MPPRKQQKTCRTKRSTRKTEQYENCVVCGKPATYGPFCGLFHEGLYLVSQHAEQQEKKGNLVTAFLFRAGGQLVEQARQNDLHKKALLYAAAKQQQARQQRQAAAAPPEPTDPFVTLGLDKADVTVEKVRNRQRELARIFHPDTGGGPAAQQRLAEINAAADEAVRLLSGQTSAP